MYHYKIKNGVNLYHIKGENFKTTLISVKFHCPLNIANTTENAVVPFVLKQGCKKYKTAGEIETELANLYGAKLNTYILKKGEDQILSLDFVSIRDEFAPKSKNVVLSLLDLMLSVVFEPLTENGVFLTQYVELAKNSLSDKIDSLLNDKREYTLYRLKQQMCIDEPYSVSEYGSKHQLAGLDAKMVFDAYKNIIKGSVIDIFICGSAPVDKIADTIKRYVSDTNASYPYTLQSSFKQQVKYITESMDVTQAKVAAGFRCDISAKDDLYYALCVANSIFGGGPHSRLFNNVREKLSLAYYAASRFDKHKAIITADAGILLENYQKTLDEIIVQLEDLKKGNISQAELDAAKAAIINSVRSAADSQYMILDFCVGEILAGRIPDTDKYCEGINGVTIENVTEAANKIHLDTVYLLRGKDGVV